MEKLLAKYTRYLELERSISPLTVRNYTSDIKSFLDFLHNSGLDSLEKVDRIIMRHYLGSLHEAGIARSSISRKLSALRSFYRYLNRERLINVDPLATITAPKLEKRLPTFLNIHDIQRLIEAPERATPQGLRDRAILELLYAAGLRVSEIVRLDIGDINLSSLEIRIWGKGAKERIGLMGKPAEEALRLYLRYGRTKLQGKRETRAIFLNRSGGRMSERSIQRIIRKYAKKAGIDVRVFPHIMRHTFATHLLDGGADLRVVQDLLGHSKLSSTQIYTHVTRSQIRRTYLAAHPRSSVRKGEQ